MKPETSEFARTDNRTNGIKRLGIFGATLRAMLTMTAAVLCVPLLAALHVGSWYSTIVFGLSALICGALAAKLWRYGFDRDSMTPSRTLGAVVANFMILILISTLIYFFRDELEPFDALYESVAGVSTSSLTTLKNPEASFDIPLLIWRSATQWLGGWGALVFAIAILPNMAGSAENIDPRDRSRIRRTKTIPIGLVKNATIAYIAATVLAVIVLAIVGMRPYEAIAHGFSLVSSGGFSTKADSLAAYDLAYLAPVVTVLMVLTGCSSVLIWLVIKFDFQSTTLLLEARYYLSSLVLATAWITWLNRSESLSANDVSFTVVSLATTTGFSVSEWGGWHPGATSLLIVMTIIGGMAGSVSGGLRWYRVLGIGQFIFRELQRQVHPRVVRPVKVGKSLVTEASADRILSQFTYVIISMTIGAAAIAASEMDLTSALTLAASAVATAGPGYDAAGYTITHAADLPTSARVALMPLMLAGRVFLFPMALSLFLWARSILRVINPASPHTIRRSSRSRARRRVTR